MAIEAIADTARAFREALGLSQAAVGRLLDLRGDQVRRIENRQRSVTLGEAAVLARVFECPLEVLADVDLARDWLADMFAKGEIDSQPTLLDSARLQALDRSKQDPVR